MCPRCLPLRIFVLFTRTIYYGTMYGLIWHSPCVCRCACPAFVLYAVWHQAQSVLSVKHPNRCPCSAGGVPDDFPAALRQQRHWRCAVVAGLVLLCSARQVWQRHAQRGLGLHSLQCAPRMTMPLADCLPMQGRISLTPQGGLASSSVATSHLGGKGACFSCASQQSNSVAKDYKYKHFLTDLGATCVLTSVENVIGLVTTLCHGCGV